MNKLKVRLLSDLHNEFSGYTWQIPEGKEDIILLLGDIGTGLKGIEWAIRQSEQLNKPVLFILGNHDLYKESLSLYEAAKEYCVNTNVTILEKDIFEFMGYRFLGTSLWTNYLLYGEAGKIPAMLAAKDFMTDHRLIKNNDGSLFMPEDALDLFKESFQWLKDNLTGTKDIVLTHHVPNHYGCHPQYRGDMLSPAFCSDLEGFILERQPLAWLSGHSHYVYKKYIGNTLCQSNTKGYPNEGLIHFNPNLIIEV